MSRNKPIIIDRCTEIYRRITLECERQRQALGWTMWQVDDAAGLNDGHYTKLCHGDRPSGRQGNWQSLQLVVSALFPRGFDVTITHKEIDPLTAEGHRRKVMFAAADNDPRSRRALMRELGRKGAEARHNLPQERRLEIAQRAGETRRRNKAAAFAAKASNSEAVLT